MKNFSKFCINYTFLGLFGGPKFNHKVRHFRELLLHYFCYIVKECRCTAVTFSILQLVYAGKFDTKCSTTMTRSIQKIAKNQNELEILKIRLHPTNGLKIRESTNRKEIGEVVRVSNGF